MTVDQILTLLVLAAVVAALIWDKIRADVVALSGAAVLLITGAVRPIDIQGAFASRDRRTRLAIRDRLRARIVGPARSRDHARGGDVPPMGQCRHLAVADDDRREIGRAHV